MLNRAVRPIDFEVSSRYMWDLKHIAPGVFMVDVNMGVNFAEEGSSD